MFMQYASLRPSERTLRLAWKMWTDGTTKEGKAMSNYYRLLANNWRWTERAAAKDFFDAQNIQAKWIERDKERREDAYELGGKLIRQSKRVLDKIERIPDEELIVSLGEAKDLAMAGTALQENAIPSIQLAADQMHWLLAALPADKRSEIVKRLSGRKDDEIKLLNDSNTIDAEFEMIEIDEDADETEEAEDY
jgi:hypothetical protein